MINPPEASAKQIAELIGKRSLGNLDILNTETVTSLASLDLEQ